MCIKGVALDVATTQYLRAYTPPGRRRRRLDGRTVTARNIKRLVAEYSARLGDAANNELVQADLQKLAETEAISDVMRAAALRGDPVDMAVVVRLQNISKRLRRVLGLDGLPRQKTTDTLEEYLTRLEQHEAAHD